MKSAKNKSLKVTDLGENLEKWFYSAHGKKGGG
jgi:hypothetical protein